MMINKVLIRKWRVPIAIASVIIFLMLFSGPGCGNQWILFYDKPIKGSVVDAETGKPLEGVLVVGMWQLSQFLSQGFGGYAKVIVVQTDREGKFKLPFWVAVKPWTIDSAMRDGAPAIMLYKPGYRFSQRVLLERILEDTTLPAETKKRVEEINNLMPAKLEKVYADEDMWMAHKDFRSYANFPGKYYSKGQLNEVFRFIEYGIHNLSAENGPTRKRIQRDVKEDRAYWLEGKR